MTNEQVQVKLRQLSNQILNSDLIIPDNRNDVRDIIQSYIDDIEDSDLEDTEDINDMGINDYGTFDFIEE